MQTVATFIAARDSVQVEVGSEGLNRLRCIHFGRVQRNSSETPVRQRTVPKKPLTRCEFAPSTLEGTKHDIEPKIPRARAAPDDCAVRGIAGLAMPPAQASSHREAPFITTTPKVDATDFYMFNSYEPGRDGYVTLIANYLPLQAPYGGPNYFPLDPNALYEIHIDNNGDAKEDITFQFRFKNTLNGDRRCTIGGKNVAIPLIQAGPGHRAERGRAERERDLHRRRGPRRPPHRRARQR